MPSAVHSSQPVGRGSSDRARREKEEGSAGSVACRDSTQCGGRGDRGLLGPGLGSSGRGGGRGWRGFAVPSVFSANASQQNTAASDQQLLVFKHSSPTRTNHLKFQQTNFRERVLSNFREWVLSNFRDWVLSNFRDWADGAVGAQTGGSGLTPVIPV
jgi:hypothetical protein